MKKTGYPLLLMLIVMAFASCNHKDLCYMEAYKTKIKVVYDWSDAPDATPGGMCVFFYSTSNSEEYYRFDFDNIKGGEIEIPAGNYLLVTYNNDTEVVKFSGTNHFDGHKASTREGDLLEPLYGNGTTSNEKTSNNERVCITPDGLWGSHATDVTINSHGITYTFHHYRESRAAESDDTTVSSGDQIITLYPHDMLCHYSYEVRNVDNIDGISKVSASLSGMSGGMNLVDESTDDENVTLPVGGAVDTGSGKITGQFLTFGHNGNDGTVAHKMTFFVVMTDGSKYRIENYDNLDVSSQVDNASDPRHVHIVIDGLKLPDSAEQDEGWKPTLDDWGVQREDLKV